MKPFISLALNSVQWSGEFGRQIGPEAKSGNGSDYRRFCCVTEPGDYLSRSVTGHYSFGGKSGDVLKMLLMYIRIIRVIPQNIRQVLANQGQQLRWRKVKIDGDTKIQKPAWRSDGLLDSKKRWVMRANVE